MSDPSQFILKFKERLELRLDRAGRRLLKESADRAEFEARSGEFDITIERTLNELCRKPDGVRPGKGDPERRAARDRRGTQEQRVAEALDKANREWANDDDDDDSARPVFTPKDEWDNAVLKAGQPLLLLVGPKYQARVELETFAETRRRFIFNLADSRFGDQSVIRATDATTPAPIASSSTAARKAVGHVDNVGSWDLVEVSFLSDFKVQIKTPRRSYPQNYGELGFADRRAKRGEHKPNLAWETMRALARGNGTIQNGSATGGVPWSKVEKRIQTMRKLLKDHFRISADPVPFVEGIGYQARFKISCAPSFDS